jgi:hypothetical protein
MRSEMRNASYRNPLATSIMSQLHKILTFGLLLASLNLSSQDLSTLNTKDLIEVSNRFGLDSALKLAAHLPIYYIDPGTASLMIDLTKTAEPTSKIDYFLVDYALHTKNNKNLPFLLFDYFSKKRILIKGYEPNYPHSLPKISQDALFALIENPTKQTDSLLIWYYNDWNDKSKKYYSDYLNGKSEPMSRKKEKLMSPFEDCNYNCYVILLALKNLGSDFYNKNKLEKHQRNLKSYWQSGFGIHKTGHLTDYKTNNQIKSITLSKSYNSLGEIDYKKEPELKELLKGFKKSYCWKSLMYNEGLGYLDLGCQAAPLEGYGIIYRLELSKNTLLVHEIEYWIS